MDAFVKYIEYHLLEKRDPLSMQEVNSVVQFNIHRKQLIDQLLALMNRHELLLGTIFEKIQTNIGMHISIAQNNIPRECFVTGDVVENGRIICLCENVKRSSVTGASFQFYCRSDVVKYLRFFYFVQHFNYYVMMRIYESTVQERWGENNKQFMDDLQLKYNTAFCFLRELIRPLEYNTVMI